MLSIIPPPLPLTPKTSHLYTYNFIFVKMPILGDRFFSGGGFFPWLI